MLLFYSKEEKKKKLKKCPVRSRNDETSWVSYCRFVVFLFLFFWNCTSWNISQIQCFLCYNALQMKWSSEKENNNFGLPLPGSHIPKTQHFGVCPSLAEAYNTYLVFENLIHFNFTFNSGVRNSKFGIQSLVNDTLFIRTSSVLTFFFKVV